MLRSAAAAPGRQSKCYERKISQISIEEYCRSHDTVKIRRFQKLVELSYNITAERSDDDAFFLERAIQREKDPELRSALEDLEGPLFG